MSDPVPPPRGSIAALNDAADLLAAACSAVSPLAPVVIDESHVSSIATSLSSAIRTSLATPLDMIELLARLR